MPDIHSEALVTGFCLINHSLLTGIYGGLTLLATSLVYVNGTQFSRATTAETWNFIITDLTFAAANFFEVLVIR